MRIFDDAAELPGPTRKLLIFACEGDPALRVEVRSLLAAPEAADNFIEQALTGQEAALTSLSPDPAFHTGTSLGPYCIVQVIGEGGMGMVYQAVGLDDLYRKLVAHEEARRGLASERMPPRRRLELFLTVFSAVRYAHQNLVVHRDIKPQNIPVDPEGAIWLLDFGIASPEQLLNHPVTTASDTYSPGVLLYVLLTGYKHFVFKTRSVPEICDVIREREPRRPAVVPGMGRNHAWRARVGEA